ncbi:hypothetical protein, partial [Paractinoplanes durhamensis]|uniref:hypothetical protein n=1 Tax=Paractinoplanes durhamensis TaxID=113563 RepID=UPI001940577D
SGGSGSGSGSGGSGSGSGGSGSGSGSGGGSGGGGGRSCGIGARFGWNSTMSVRWACGLGSFMDFAEFAGVQGR